MAETDGPLRALLGADPPESVSALPTEVRTDLAALISDAQRNQAADLRVAFDAVLRHVPFPLRGIVKRVLRR